MMPWDKLREECGVFGIRTHGVPAAPYAHLGLYALQHRGQESAGIATFDGQRHAPRQGDGPRRAGVLARVASRG